MTGLDSPLFARAKLLSKDEDLEGVISRQHSGTGNGTEDVGTSSLSIGEGNKGRESVRRNA